MKNDDKLHIYENNNVFEVTLKWYTPMAWFFLFFSTIWCGFLFFFYGMMAMSSNTPFFAYLFPLLHVAAGIGMAYYTACLFLNKTYMDVVDGHLMVHHDPIPWWKGNVSIPVNSIEQLYVKEKVSRGKNGESRSYNLRAKLKDGGDKALLNIGMMTSEKLQRIETALEGFLGISDYPVKGEYGGSNRVKVPQLPKRRQQRRGFSKGGFFEPLYFSKEGSLINLHGQSQQLVNETQYDWNDGNSEKLFQLLTDDDKETLLFFTQNRALLNVFEEEQIPLSNAYIIRFDENNPSQTLNYHGVQYTLDHHSKGMKYVSGMNETLETKQWKYISSDGKHSFRIVGRKGAFSYYKGSQLNENDFELGLDLNKNAPPIIEDRGRDWEEGDFV